MSPSIFPGDWKGRGGGGGGRFYPLMWLDSVPTVLLRCLWVMYESGWLVLEMCSNMTALKQIHGCSL